MDGIVNPDYRQHRHRTSVIQVYSQKRKKKWHEISFINQLVDTH